MKQTALYTYKQVANICGVCERTVWGWVNKGILKACKMGRSVRITETALNEFLSNSQKVQVENG